MTGLCPMRWSLIIPSYCLAVSLVVLYFQLAATFAKSEIFGAVSVFFLFTISGVGWRHYFSLNHRKDRATDYVYNLGCGKFTVWGNIFLHAFLPIRSSQFSYPLVIAILLCLHESLGKPRQSAGDRLLFRFAGILTGLLPVLHGQMALAVVVYVIIVVCLTRPESTDEKHNWLAFLIMASAIGGPQLLFSLTTRPTFQPAVIWRRYIDNGDFFAMSHCLFDAFGIFGILAFTFPFFFCTKRQRALYLPSVVFFVVSLFFKFQANGELNFVVMYPLWASIAVVAVLFSLWEWTRYPSDEQLQGVAMAFALLFCIGMTAGGFVGIKRQLPHSKEIWNWEDLEMASWIERFTKTDDVFVSYWSPFEIASTLTGRTLYTLEPTMAKRYGFKCRADEVIAMYDNVNSSSVIVKANYFLQNAEVSDPGVFKYPSPTIWKLAHEEGSLQLYKVVGS